MRVLCSNCNLNCHMEEYKERLEEMIVRKNHNLLDNEVISLSEFVDDLIASCIYCNTNSLCESNKKKMNYYGDKHLIFNLYSYIADEIRNNQLIYICIDKDIYKELIKTLKINRVSTDNIIYKSVKEVTLGKRSLKVIDLEKEVKKFFTYDQNQYSGLRWIVDPIYIRNNTLHKDYSGMNEKAAEYLLYMNVDVMYIYDAYECMHENKKLFFKDEIKNNLICY